MLFHSFMDMVTFFKNLTIGDTRMSSHSFHKFVLALDKPINALGGYNQPLDDDTKLLVVTPDGNKSTFLLRDLIKHVNRHNLCVTSQVFENCDEEPPLFATEEESEDSFEPIEGHAWGFNSQMIAWYKTDNDLTALVIAPGYRIHAVKEDKSGILVEDTNRDKIFIEYGTFHPALCFETKQDFIDCERKKRMTGEYAFRDWDYFLVATNDHNYRTINKLIQIGWPDFKRLLERYEQNGLDNETCLDEGNIKLGIPWIAFFKKVSKNHDFAVVKAFLGVPGYKIESIVPKSEETKPGLNIVDENGESFWVSWSSWHDAFNFPSYQAFKTAKEQGKIKYKKRGYANVSKTRFKIVSDVTSTDVKPLHATAIWDTKIAKDLPDEEVMNSLQGVTPLKD